jgi:hypothetical protein
LSHFVTQNFKQGSPGVASQLQRAAGHLQSPGGNLRRMNLAEIATGALLALPFELVAHVGWDRYKRWEKETRIKKTYSFLARKYANLRGGHTPTGGSIELIQNKNGTFNVVGRNPDGSTQWEGELRMSMEEKDVGTATYRYPLQADYGTQRVVYIPYRDILHVVGTNRSTTEHTDFVHVWDPYIHVDKFLT